MSWTFSAIVKIFLNTAVNYINTIADCFPLRYDSDIIKLIFIINLFLLLNKNVNFIDRQRFTFQRFQRLHSVQSNYITYL